MKKIKAFYIIGCKVLTALFGTMAGAGLVVMVAAHLGAGVALVSVGAVGVAAAGVCLKSALDAVIVEE